MVDLGDDLPMLRLDPVLFEQVLFNLLDNAAKYAPAGTEIRVSGAQENGIVRVQVIDEGEGIRPSDLERIFDKFYRVHAEDRQARRYRSGTCDLPRFCRGHGRHHRGR